jgi:dTDP-4-dehydrorhamnose 3,5-epimerase
MKAERLAVPDVILVHPTRHSDPRGFFSETWSAAPYAELGIGPGFVQDNYSRSVPKGVIGGCICRSARTRRASWCVSCVARSGTLRLA